MPETAWRIVTEAMKTDRHTRIIELISEYDIETQEELTERLREAGYSVTQATVSRDIRELKLTKIMTENGIQKYIPLRDMSMELYQKYVMVLKTGFLSMEQAQNILVLKTVSGMAMAVAAAIDALEIPGVVGTIAGDDTVMCAVTTTESVGGVMNRIHTMIHK